jgi:hypothetical protein
MHRYILSRGAMKSLRRIPKARVEQIFEVFEELAEMKNPAEHHNTKEMKGSWRALRLLLFII